MRTTTLTVRMPGCTDPIDVPCKHAPLWWHTAGRQYTASGYGSRIPTEHMVQLPGSPRWRRVYCCIRGNSGTCYVDGPKDADGKRTWIVVSE